MPLFTGLLAQFPDDLSANPPNHLGEFWVWPFLVVYAFLFLVSGVYTLFWAWMMFECVRSEPDKSFWMWLMIIAPFPGALV